MKVKDAVKIYGDYWFLYVAPKIKYSYIDASMLPDHSDFFNMKWWHEGLFRHTMSL